MKITEQSNKKQNLKILFINPNSNDEFERLLMSVIIEKIENYEQVSNHH